MIENSKEIQERQLEESNDRLAEPVPPVDIVAFTEARSCADLFRLFQKQQLEIQPNFQRKVVWSDRDQTLFVDSLMKQMPIPSLCISLDAKTQQRVVIDGLQRMYTIIRFLDFAKKDWRLSCSEDVDERISGKLVSEIYNNESALFSTLENLTIPVTVLRCDYSKSTHMDYLFQIFRRLNSGGRRLLNQEIRNCIYQGRFNDYLRTVVRSPEWLNVMCVTKARVENARYGHEERALRFFAMESGWESYSGNLSKFLNDYMKAHKNISEEGLRVKDELLRSVLSLSAKIGLPKDLLRNKNLMEGLMVGLARNVDSIRGKSSEWLHERYEQLMLTNPYSGDIKEGMAHTDKVHDRIRQSIEAFAP